MTNEEARKILDSSFVWQKMVDEECEALGMAIKALETMERIEARKQKLEKKMHNSFSLSEATEHYALVRLLALERLLEAEND